MRISFLSFQALALMVAVAVCGPAAAQSLPAANPNTVQANAGTVGIISGGVDGTYVRIAADLASVLDDGKAMRILPILGKGSLQNLADILYLRGVDVGIVQSDVLAFVKQRHLLPGAEQNVEYIAKLYDEEVHVLARKDIARIADLNGQAVNVDVSGSGTAMTVALLYVDVHRLTVQVLNASNILPLENMHLFVIQLCDV